MKKLIVVSVCMASFMIAKVSFSCEANLQHDSVYPPYWSTDLMYASAACELEKMEALLKSGVNVNFQNPMSGKTALHFALISGHSNKVECVNLLLKHGADPFIRDFGDNGFPGISIDQTLKCDASNCEQWPMISARTAMEIMQHGPNRPSLAGLDLNLPHLVRQSENPIQNGRALMNDLFDGIYLLNLVDSPSGAERYEKFLKRIEPLGSFQFDRVPGIYFNEKYGKNTGYIGDGIFNEQGKVYDFNWFKDNKRILGIGESADGTLMGQIGVTLGHLQILKKAKVEGKRRILILEDDIAFAPFFIESAKLALDELDRNESSKWGLLYLDTNTRYFLRLNDSQKYEKVKKAEGMLMVSCVVVNESLFDVLIKRLSDIFDATKPPLPPIDVVLGNEIQASHDAYFVFPLPAYQDDGGFSQIGY